MAGLDRAVGVGGVGERHRRDRHRELPICRQRLGEHERDMSAWQAGWV